MKYGLLVIAIIVNAFANLLMKFGALKIGSIKDLGFTEILLKFVTNQYLILGILFFAFNIILYVIVLTKINISVVYPIWTSGADEALTLTPIVPMTLESAIEYIKENEYAEITPTQVRLRKKLLKDTERKRAK